jgi:hypothetical protein
VVDTVEIPALSEEQAGSHDARNAGKIAFDERGNAVYEWQFAPMTDDGFEGEQLRAQALEHPGLAIVDDDPPPGAPIRKNAVGARVGYNPYDSGQLDRKASRKPANMRELSKWIELRKKLAASRE